MVVPGFAATTMPPIIIPTCSRIYTNRFRASYSVPAGWAVDARAVAPPTALGAAALPQTLPSAAAIAAVAERGRQGTPSSTSKSLNPYQIL